MSAIHQVLLAGSGAGYQITNSLRFRAANSAYLSRTFGSPTSSTVWTFSAWCKRGTLGSTSYLLGASTTTNFGFNSSNQLVLTLNGTTACTSTAVFRDPSAWMHIVYQQNGSAQTIYVNNASVATGTTAAAIFNTAIAHQVGAANTTNFFDGHLANVYWIDGQALTPSSFGQTDATTGVWVPKAYSGTFGANGFFLEFKDAASTTTIGYDTSGNANNFTTNGISVTAGVTFDQMTDTPTNNYCTLSPIYTDGAGAISGANLNFNGLGSNYNIASTIGVSSGKWYWEYTGAAGQLVGIFLQGGLISSTTGALSYFSDGNKYTGSTPSAYGASWLGSDVIGVALDLDAGTLTFYKNNVSQGTAFSSLSGTYFPWVRTSTSATGSLNFGQRAFSYTPPSGFKALNTANLSVPTIKKPSLYMDATLRTGTGATASVSSLGFQPDLVWIKSRSAATDHGLYDAVRGVQNQLESNTTTDETAEATGLTAFNSNGYTVGALAQLNTNAATYVDWAWKEGATPGFDIVTYTGNGAARTISHTLGAIPKFMIVKARSTASTDQGWAVYHASNTAAPETDYLLLNSTAATADLDTVWNDTAPTASVFSVGTNALVNTNNDTYVAYLWSEIAGFSRISSYTGNGSTDGPFVWCGFRPAFVMIKRGDSAENWSIQDDARNPFNVVDARLKPNSADVEAVSSVQNVDFLANGFKLRNTDPEKNASGGTYIFAAFAEAPFKYARAR